MKWIHQFFLLTRGKQIALVVCAVHFLVIFGSLGHHFVTRKLKPPRPMVVKTIAPMVKAPPRIASAPPVAAAPQGKKEAVKPKEKKKEAKVAKSVKAKPPAKAAVKPAPIAKEENQESFVATPKPRAALNVPARIEKREEAPPIEAAGEPTYNEFLIAYLQMALDLPEFGEVRAKIKIDRFGKLIDCEILEAKSKKNGEFLKERLPDLSFPCLADFGIMEATQTFTIAFRNS